MTTEIDDKIEYLLSRIESAYYSHKLREGRIYVTRGSRPDMYACIAVFMSVDHEVRVINVFAGKRPYTMFFRGFDNEWYDARAALPNMYSAESTFAN